MENIKVQPDAYSIVVKWLETTKDAIKSWFDIESTDRDGRTMLHNAVIVNDTSIARYLIQEWANINAQDKIGWSPLFFAIQDENINMVSLLLSSADLDPNIQDSYWNSALTKAVYFSNWDLSIIKAIIEKWWDVLRGAWNTIPINLAKLMGYDAIVNFMSQYIPKK